MYLTRSATERSSGLYSSPGGLGEPSTSLPASGRAGPLCATCRMEHKLHTSSSLTSEIKSAMRALVQLIII